MDRARRPLSVFSLSSVFFSVRAVTDGLLYVSRYSVRHWMASHSIYRRLRRYQPVTARQRYSIAAHASLIFSSLISHAMALLDRYREHGLSKAYPPHKDAINQLSS